MECIEPPLTFPLDPFEGTSASTLAQTSRRRAGFLERLANRRSCHPGWTARNCCGLPTLSCRRRPPSCRSGAWLPVRQLSARDHRKPALITTTKPITSSCSVSWPSVKVLELIKFRCYICRTGWNGAGFGRGCTCDMPQEPFPTSRWVALDFRSW